MKEAFASTSFKLRTYRLAKKSLSKSKKLYSNLISTVIVCFKTAKLSSGKGSIQ